MFVVVWEKSCEVGKVFFVEKCVEWEVKYGEVDFCVFDVFM